MGKKSITRTLAPLVVVTGPTASGKSTLALRIAKEFGGEVINADSRQVYRGMDVGTAKVPPAEQENVSHHLFDIVDPDHPFTLQEYQQRAIEIIREVGARGNLPLLVGGTGLYIQAVVDNYRIPSVAPHAALRAQLEKKDAATLFAELVKIDPEAARTIDRANTRRLIRAIEVALLSSLSRSQASQKGEPLFSVLMLGAEVPRRTLYQRIDERVHQMIEAGLVEEVERLRAKGYDSALSSLSGIGYKELIEYLDGRGTLQEAVRKIQSHTRQFARRQLTWFRKEKRIIWIRSYEEAQAHVRGFLNTVHR